MTLKIFCLQSRVRPDVQSAFQICSSIDEAVTSYYQRSKELAASNDKNTLDALSGLKKLQYDIYVLGYIKNGQLKSKKKKIGPLFPTDEELESLFKVDMEGDPVNAK